jgi:hypothetical protein
MSDLTYAVHTATCTYLLDEDGICRWTHVPTGVAPPGAERCVGAQFVACLDLASEGGLVGELRLGAAALFVRREDGRFLLLRTLPIERVEIRAPAPPEDPHSFADTPVREGGFSPPVPLPTPSSPWQPVDPQTEPIPAYPFNPEETALLDPSWSTPEEQAEPLDLEDLLSISVTEVTVSLPLYRLLPRAPPAPHHPPVPRAPPAPRKPVR